MESKMLEIKINDFVIRAPAPKITRSVYCYFDVRNIKSNYCSLFWSIFWMYIYGQHNDINHDWFAVSKECGLIDTSFKEEYSWKAKYVRN